MWIKPISFSTAAATIQFADSMERMPLPPWSGVPVALPLEVDGETLERARMLEDVGVLSVRNEDGDLVQCVAVIDEEHSHTCETDTVLMLVQCGPFEYQRNQAEAY